MLLLLKTFLGAERAQQLMRYYQAPNDSVSLRAEAVADLAAVVPREALETCIACAW